jgi:rod shape-determining protein MreD
MDVWVRHLIPFGMSFALVLLSVIPVGLPGYSSIAPLLPVMGVYYWAIYRPDLLPAWAAFVIGLLADILAGTPLGVNALVLLLVQCVTASQRRFFLAKSFLVAWWAFAVLAAGAIGLIWLLVSLLDGRLIDPGPVAVDYIVMLGLFPVLTRLLAQTQMAFLKDV